MNGINNKMATLCFTFFAVQKVNGDVINYENFNYDYPVSTYFPRSSEKANVLGRILKINNVTNDYSVSIPMDLIQNGDGKINYFGLSTSTNAYFTHDSGNSITNAGSLTGPNTLVGPGLQSPVRLPIPQKTITIDNSMYYFNYYVVQTVLKKEISPTYEVQGNNYALQPLDILPRNANFAWSYYSDSPGAVIHYKTDKNIELLSSPTIIGESGDLIPSSPREFEGYTLVSQHNPTTFKKDSVEQLTYIYTKNPISAVNGGNVTSKYVDINGTPISDDVIQSGNINDLYDTMQKDISGYTFKNIQGKKSGQFTAAEQVVTYIYTKNPVIGGRVISKYVDINGTPISDDVTQSGNIGDAYDTEQKNISGYTFKEIQGNKSGQFLSQNQVVTYIYTQNQDVIKSDSSTPSESTNSKNKLPETGDNQRASIVYVVLGSCIIFILSLITMLKYKKQ
ncbi:MucBP domain-containing protein [Pseudolactococcus carnosus]|uniref:MucBP domain-containing protein n=1 Tax=Pseudolactococcus carnosus TaxID=2749961 RepID=UPI001FB98B80|nr:MucBP domain-containing protein [Lactococcus carnosus]MCJ1979578.1 MucBP domain-containing protein [Lactococcus carnosus]